MAGSLKDEGRKSCIDKTEQGQPRVRSTRPGLVWDTQLGSGECDTACAELELKGKIVGGEMRNNKSDID